MSEVLVVASKVKAKIKESGMNTSSTAIQALTKIIEHKIEEAVENARKDKRKTVLDRDLVE